MNYARIAIVEVQGGPVAAQNMGSVTTFNGLLKIFSKAGSSAPSTLSLSTITGELVPCLNTTDDDLENGDQVFVGQIVDGRWAVIPTGTSTPGGSGTARFQFVTTGKMTNRAVTVKVLRAHNSAPDIDDTGLLVPGDTLTVYDPFSMWSDVEAKATGWAYLAQAQSDDGTTTDIDEEHVLRYEIEECTLPIKRVEGILKSCIHAGTAAAVIVDLSDPNFADRELIRCSYPNVDNPEADITEVTEGSPPATFEQISCQNPYNYDAIAGSKVVIERVTNKRTSDPENYEAPLARSADTHQWEIVQVEKKFANYIKVLRAGGQWVQQEAFDGYYPDASPSDTRLTGCAPTISHDLGSCIENGDEGYAFFNTLTGNYKVISTDSAFYGKPDDATVVTSATLSGCTLTAASSSVKVFCPAVGGSNQESSLSVTTQTVATGATIAIESCGQCAWRWQWLEEGCLADCLWEWDAFTLEWRRPDFDSDCPGDCGCSPPAYPDNPNDLADGEPGPSTPCIGESSEADWVKVSECASPCTCNENPTFPYNPDIGDEHYEACGDGGGDPVKKLCVTTERVSFSTIDCGGGSSNLPPPVDTKSCIDIDEDCPDACANPVS